MKLGAFERIAKERVRQQIQEDYSLDHDDEHDGCQMAILAAAYALSSYGLTLDGPTRPYRPELTEVLELLDTYGWEFKPKDPIRDLERAGALIVAELERQLRKALP